MTAVVAVVAVGHLLDRLAAIRPDVGDGHELDVGLGQHRPQDDRSAVTDADAGEPNPLARRDGTVQAQCRGGHHGGCRDGRGRGDRGPPVKGSTIDLGGTMLGPSMVGTAHVDVR